MHTGDIRGRAMPVHNWEGECELDDLTLGTIDKPYAGGCAGGVAARKIFVDAIRANVTNHVLVDAGNYYFGSTRYQMHKGLGDVPFINELAYDVMGAGQCEFFSGTRELEDYLKVQDPSIVTVISNLDVLADSIATCKKGGSGPACVKPYDVIVKGGRKIGLLGFVPMEIFDIATPGETVKIIPYKTAAESAIAAMKLAHPDVDIIIATSQMDLASSKDLAKYVAGIDVIVQGNHYIFEAGDPDNPYPLVLSGANTADGNPTYVVAGGHFGDLLGRLDVTFNADGVITGYNTATSNTYRMELTLDSTTDLYIPDQGVYKYDTASDTFNTWDKVVAEYNNVETFKGTVEGQTAQEVDGSRENYTPVCGSTGVFDRADFKATCAKDPDTGLYGTGSCCHMQATEGADADACCPAESFWNVYGCRHSDCPMGRLATNALMMECTDCAFALTNGGSIRASFESSSSYPTDVTYGDLISVFPFQNTVATFSLKGTALREAIEHSLADYLPDDGEGKFLHYAGLRFAWNPTAPNNDKVISVQICPSWDSTFDAVNNPAAGRCTGDWNDMVPHVYYKIATNNYIRGGGDGYGPTFEDQAINVNDFGIAMEVSLKNYLNVTDPYTIPEDELLDSTTCNGEVNDYKQRWEGTAEGMIPSHANCRSYKSSGLTELTCPTTALTESFCLTYSGDFVQDLGNAVSGICPANKCSGFGKCNNATFTCECKEVEISDFKDAPQGLVIDAGDGANTCGAGFSMHKGDSCEIERTKWKFSGAPLVYILALVNIALGLFAIYWYQANGKYAIIRITQPLFHQVSAAGGVVAAVGAVLLVLPAESGMCHPSIIVAALGLMIMYSAVFQKTARLDKVMNNKKLAKLKVSDLDLIKQIFVTVAAELIAIIVLISIAPIYPTASPLEGAWEYKITCSAGDKFDLWVMVLVIFQFGLLAYGCYLAYRIRNVGGAMNESFYIGISLYTSLLIGVVAIFVILNSLNNPDLVYIVGPATINICSIVNILVTLLPKLVNLTDVTKKMTGTEVMKMGTNATSGGTTATGDGGGNDIIAAVRSTSEAAIKESLAGISEAEKNRAIKMAEAIIKLASEEEE